MLDRINNWHLSILIIAVSFLSVFLAQKYVLAQWNDPIGLPGENGSFRLVVNPLAEDLDLNSFSLRDNANTDFILDPGGTSGLQVSGIEKGIFGSSEALTGVGVYGEATRGEGDGVMGIGSAASGGSGVYGSGYSGVRGHGQKYGVKGIAEGALVDSAGIYGERNVGSYAGLFLGRVAVNGNNTNGGERILNLFDNSDVVLRLDSNAKTNTAQIEFVRGDVLNSDYSWLGPTKDDSFDMWTMENIPMLFGINNQERMRLEPSGNLKVSGALQPGSYSSLPYCDSDAYGSLVWNQDCGTGNGCLQVCTEIGWLSLATN